MLRSFQVQPGKWTTLEFDLRQAVKERRLDLKRMAVLSVTVTQLAGKTKRRFTARMDNIRLATATAPARLPVVRDDSSMALPDYFRTNTRPTPEKMPSLVSDRRRLKLQPQFFRLAIKALSVDFCVHISTLPRLFVNPQ